MANVILLEQQVEIPQDLRSLADASLDGGRVRLAPKAGGAADRYAEMEGPPDLVVDIVSDASIGKDTERLPAAYDRAGVRESWLVDARGSELLFQIHALGSTGYRPVAPDAQGFQDSAVLACAYRLERGRNRHGRLTFDLLSRGVTEH